MIDDDQLGQVVVTLFQGVLYRENAEPQWQALLDLQARVRDYCSVIGLELILDEAEGYAYLRQRASKPETPDLPRLVQRRQLSFPVSLILVLLRKKLAEFDALSADTRLVVSREDIVDQMRLFLPDTANEARLLDRMDTHLGKVVDLGFLRRLRGQDGQFEVRRVLKAFVDAQWLDDFAQRLDGYARHAGASAGKEGVE
ncbi:hypothetical protein ABIB42_005161 [Massilia sp. UYP32]|jgi:hypothetical protein|uniref:DUF4194 domain-containing protein n=1 Tax=Massilia timonae CCUG 45783 TaxID=883126 RepID=K9DH84_9BURK|nr:MULTISPECIES: DUF4194 domain-containing protein [Massilia]EKU83608.1 hypothetical protein HMPREF9710_01116 [Massilia timonae CCUG 45783]QYG00093.1 DUF4194 domain-containing protein [Massilia sp. NP310]